ncbi:uncharacterized protein LOC111086193 [Limulus polyphemus]|uniref:Uncharacterized protein LOC111086193 n=1 Tax=Limulus polyphemus TaxID=6850 RepID=A0ABM1SJG4_LIMPO|nr:uncharacterized protein LOC111086193 [Limulus polyphemus]
MSVSSANENILSQMNSSPHIPSYGSINFSDNEHQISSSPSSQLLKMTHMKKIKNTSTCLEDFKECSCEIGNSTERRLQVKMEPWDNYKTIALVILVISGIIWVVVFASLFHFKML